MQVRRIAAMHHMYIPFASSIIVVAVAMIGAAWWATPAWAEKFCDLTARDCVEQNCQTHFDNVRKGILEAYRFFERLGYVGQYDVDIQFKPEILAVQVPDRTTTKVRLLGKYDENEKKIYMTCWGEKWLSEENDFGLEMTADLYTTIITHEMIHFLTNRYAKARVDVLLSEYIAYSGQLSLFPQEKIDLLISKFNATAFEDNEIRESTLVMNPGLFALKSYLHFKKTNGVLAKQIIEGSYRAPPTQWPPY
jgi:hypothetical protein